MDFIKFKGIEKMNCPSEIGNKTVQHNTFFTTIYLYTAIYLKSQYLQIFNLFTQYLQLTKMI